MRGPPRQSLSCALDTHVLSKLLIIFLLTACTCLQLVEVAFSEAERAFYDQLKARSRLEFEGFVASGNAMQVGGGAMRATTPGSACVCMQHGFFY